MSDAPKYTTLRDYLRVVREQRILIVLIVLVFAGAAVALSERAKPVYEARASLAFHSPNDDFRLLGAAVGATQTPEAQAASASQSIRTISVAREAAKELKPGIAPGVLLDHITVRAEARTNFVDVSAKARTAQRAADEANAFAHAARRLVIDNDRRQYSRAARDLIRQNKTLSRRPVNNFTRGANADRINRLKSLAKFALPVTIEVPASAADSPISPKPIRDGLLGLLVGLTIALLVAFIRDSLDRRFRSSREMTDELKLPLLGHVNDDLLGRSISANGRKAISGAELEAFRIVRANIDFLDVDSKASTMVVTSALPEEGKSTVATALAAAYAAAGRKVLLVECDLRRPTLAKRLGVNAQPGLADYLIGEATPEEIIQEVTIPVPLGLTGDDEKPPTLVCISAGTPTPHPAELLASRKFETFLAEVAEAYDAVVIDSTPLLSIVDTLEIVPHVARVVMCVRASKTTRDQARAARSALQHFPDRPIGIVVTGVRKGDESDYGYYSYAYAYAGKR